MTVRSFKLDPATGDLAVANNRWVLLSDGPAIAQACQTTLRVFLGEWYLDLTLGIPYFERILVAHPDVQVISGLFKTALRGILGVVDVTNLQLQYDRAARRCNVAWSVATDAGLLTGITQTLSGGGG